MSEAMTARWRERNSTRQAAIVEHIATHVNLEGLWHSNSRSRAQLPFCEKLKDRQRLRILAGMVAAGLLERPFTGFYRPAETKEKTI